MEVKEEKKITKENETQNNNIESKIIKNENKVEIEITVD